MNNVLLIIPPFFMGVSPCHQASLLKAALTARGIQSSILYANILFKTHIDPELYDKLAVLADHNDVIEWIFASHAFPEYKNRHKTYGRLLQKQDSHLFQKLQPVIEKTHNLLQQVSNIITEKKPHIVWVYNFVKQTTVSIAITNCIKSVNNDIITCMGGHSCQLPMGAELLKIAPSIDYILSGEQEITFVDFCKSALQGNVFLEQKYPTPIIHCTPVPDLNELPLPDYSDFREQTSKAWMFNNNTSIETSRGCFIGAHLHCIFCGLHTKSAINYRKMSTKRMLELLEHAAIKNHGENIIAEDTIMPADFPEKVLKHFKKPSHLKNIFFEVSPNLHYTQLCIMKQNGISMCQSGIESINDKILMLLNKKTTAINNIRFLRDCRSLEIKVLWNFLYGIPGDSVQFYKQIINISPLLVHLQPPYNIRPLFIPRYSPLFEYPDRFGLTGLSPLESYRFIFPTIADTNKLSIFFTANIPTVCKDKAVKQSILNAMKTWQYKWQDATSKPVLTIIPSDNYFSIYDTRFNNTPTQIPIKKTHSILLNKLRVPINTLLLNQYIIKNNYEQEFNYLKEKQCVLEINNQYISLVTDTLSIENIIVNDNATNY